MRLAFLLYCRRISSRYHSTPGSDRALVSVPKPHPDLRFYLAKISRNGSVCGVAGFSLKGTYLETSRIFNTIDIQLMEVYGLPVVLSRGHLWKFDWGSIILGRIDEKVVVG